MLHQNEIIVISFTIGLSNVYSVYKFLKAMFLYIILYYEMKDQTGHKIIKLMFEQIITVTTKQTFFFVPKTYNSPDSFLDT